MPLPTIYIQQDNQYQHSFPTRRSSDLTRRSPTKGTPGRSSTPSSPTTGGCRCSGCPGRSEEHTSELQSLAYLVCRLLLEKEKYFKPLQIQQEEQLLP